VGIGVRGFLFSYATTSLWKRLSWVHSRRFAAVRNESGLPSKADMPLRRTTDATGQTAHNKVQFFVAATTV
jgi:hypothetical protein